MKQLKSKTAGLTQLFGDNVRTYRMLLGWSQEYLAELLGVSKNTIYDIETGKKFVRAQRLVQLAEAFNTEVYRLFLPKKIKDVDPTKIMMHVSNQVRQSLKDIQSDFFKKGTY